MSDHSQIHGARGGGSLPGELPAPPRLREFTKLPLLIVAAMFLAGAILYPSLPSPIPTYWGPSGAPDAFAAKSFGSVFFLPLLSLGVYVLLIVAPYFDPKRRSLKTSLHAYNVVIDAVIGLQAVVFAATMAAAYNAAFDVAKIVLISVGVLFAIIGNFMTTVKQNWTFGVRVSWTLSDEVVWQRANLLGGRLFVAGGAITVVCAFLPPPANFVIMLTTIFAIVIATYVYAYLVFRSRHPEA